MVIMKNAQNTDVVASSENLLDQGMTLSCTAASGMSLKRQNRRTLPGDRILQSAQVLSSLEMMLKWSIIPGN